MVKAPQFTTNCFDGMLKKVVESGAYEIFRTQCFLFGPYFFLNLIAIIVWCTYILISYFVCSIFLSFLSPSRSFHLSRSLSLFLSLSLSLSLSISLSLLPFLPLLLSLFLFFPSFFLLSLFLFFSLSFPPFLLLSLSLLPPLPPSLSLSLLSSLPFSSFF